MKNIFLLTIGVVLSYIVQAQTSIYDQPVNDIEGNAISLTNYSGKKLLLIVLPLAEADTSVQQQLLRLQQRYDSSLLQVVGLVAMEEGYDSMNKASIQQQYSGLLLTEGMYVRKSAGSNQAALLQWLTNKDNNQHFDEDAAEAGKKFFVSEDGRLYALLGGSTSLDARIVDKIVTTQVPADNNQ
jgi:glutathione peroxidase-family protein